MNHVVVAAVTALLAVLLTAVPVALLALRWREAAGAEKAAASAWRTERDADRARLERIEADHEDRAQRMKEELDSLREENTRLHAATDLTQFMAESAARHGATLETLKEAIHVMTQNHRDAMKAIDENHRQSLRANEAVLGALEALGAKMKAEP